ncbi:type II toxin-antitoxin system ParD family antitoxin [Novosphingobium sp. MMS21-SN21R]|uniref:type II toxin-antitoxin system ParD family antitoxin n=1 Tax=Novosphingobium sp. MMS21-SN21R TaxID=2969298 RepID=UPI0028857639|nr:type II toxin-antitoxin system ParD family antitoxin [Novosphingobium sp. MMS21-SN21R]MDT0506704.1 type II toxin-antitoxin system ParD family antitoxin [Novosphingobium sp. MMS21-SN21R]
MGKVEKISVALTDELLASVHGAVKSGDYASSSEVIREALRQWKTRRTHDEQAAAALRHLVAEADASGASHPWEGGEALKQRFRNMRDGDDE